MKHIIILILLSLFTIGNAGAKSRMEELVGDHKLTMPSGVSVVVSNEQDDIRIFAKTICQGGYKFVITYGYRATKHSTSNNMVLQSQQIYQTVRHTKIPQPVPCVD